MTSAVHSSDLYTSNPLYVPLFALKNKLRDAQAAHKNATLHVGHIQNLDDVGDPKCNTTCVYPCKGYAHKRA